MPEVTAPPAASPGTSAPSSAAPGAAPAEENYVPELMKQLMKDVTEDEKRGSAGPADKPAGGAAPKDGDGKPAAEKPAGEKPAGEKPADGGDVPIRVRKAKKERPALPTEDQPAGAAPAPQPARPAAAQPEDTAKRKVFEDGLEANEREMLDDARYLEEKVDGAKYKGFAARTEKFLKDHIDWTEKPDFDPDDPAYLKWVEENQPRLSRQEIRAIEQSRIAETVRKENDGKFSDIKFKSFQREKEPEIQQLGRTAYAEMTNKQLPDEIGTLLREQIKAHGPEKGYQEAMKTHRLEIETAEEILQAAADDIAEFHRLNAKDPETGRSLVDFAMVKTDPKYVQHQRIATMVRQICDNFKENAGEDALRDGKWFVTRGEWIKIPPNRRSGFWTFTNAELIDRAKGGIKGVISNAIQGKHERLKAWGWSAPQRSAAPAAAAENPGGGGSKPAPRPAMAPAGGGDAGSPKSDGARLAGVLESRD